MEITKDNYAKMEPIIINEIESSDFISFDLEFTGLGAYLENFLDTPEDRYFKLKSTAERFRIIQFGIVTWKKTNTAKYQAKPFNIYVFPSEENGNYNFNSEVSALIFNRNQGMDFNKWIRKGVNYINSKQLKYLSDNLMEHNINLYDPSDSSKFKNISLYKEDDRLKYSMFTKKFSDFFYSQQSSFEFEKLPRFFMMYILNNLQPAIRNSIYINEKSTNGKITFEMIKVTEEERKALLEKEYHDKVNELSKNKGVKNIYDALVKGKKKILIGHNSILDILYCMSHFGDTIPNTYQEFKKYYIESFEGVYDTKMMYSVFNPELKNNCLENVFTSLQLSFKEKIGITIPSEEGFTDYLDEKQKGLFHQADYDAFVTGCAFVYMIEAMQDGVKSLNYKLNMVKSFYNCHDLTGAEIYEVPGCICYCLKPTQINYEFELQKNFEPKYFELIKKSYYVDNCNALLILVQTDPNTLIAFEGELLKHKALFQAFTLGNYKKLMKEEDEKRKANR